MMNSWILTKVRAKMYKDHKNAFLQHKELINAQMRMWDASTPEDKEIAKLAALESELKLFNRNYGR